MMPRLLAGGLAALLLSLTTLSAQRAAWTARIERNATLTVACRGAPVIESTFCFWGPNWGWVEVQNSIGATVDGGVPVQGGVPGLGLTWSGRASLQGSVLELALTVTAERDLRGITGGGIEFTVRRGSAAVGGRGVAPVLRDDRSGWSWAPLEGQTVNATFAPPLRELYFEGGGERVRCMMIAGTLKKGQHPYRLTLALPAGAKLERSLTDRYGPLDTSAWLTGALPFNGAPIDLSFLNADDRPAGKRGAIKVKGDGLVFADGTPAKLWGANLAAYALFVPPEQIPAAAKRVAQMGYNLMRIHHHDSGNWVQPTVLDLSSEDSQKFDATGLDRVDRWVAALKAEGVYVWLDLHVGRVFKTGDRIPGFPELERTQREAKGFCYLNERVRTLMAEFQTAYLRHVNPYTKLAYKDDPAVAGVLLTNENDLTHHFGHMMLPDKNNPQHNRMFVEAARVFGKKVGLGVDALTRTWEAGAGKLFLNDVEYRFNRFLIDDLARLGVNVPIATTNFWGDNPMYSLPALTAGNVIDIHSYGEAEALSADPRYTPNWLTRIGLGRVHGMPLTITEWNLEQPFTVADRFTAPAYLASIACLQGWDAPMMYNYSQMGFDGPTSIDTWSMYFDPALHGAMPAAAVLYRRGHVRPATKRYCLQLDTASLYGKVLTPANVGTVRTLLEQSQIGVGLPDAKELDWDKATPLGSGVTAVKDFDRDFLPNDAQEVVSDTGELRRDFRVGRQVIDTPKTQAVNGWLEGVAVPTKDAVFTIATPKAFVALTSLDDLPLAASKRILVTAVARAESTGGHVPLLSEPVVGEIALASKVAGLRLVPLRGDGSQGEAKALTAAGGRVKFGLEAKAGTHWFLLEAK